MLLRRQRHLKNAVLLFALVALVVHVQFTSIRVPVESHVDKKGRRQQQHHHETNGKDDDTVTPFHNITPQATLKNATPDDFHFCTTTSIGAGAVGSEGGGGGGQRLSVEHTCRGPAYDAFTSRLRAFVVRDDNSTSTTTRWWGRRPHGIPAHQTVLWMGNPHTRLVGQVLACHSSSSSSAAGGGGGIRRLTKYDGHAVRIDFTNDSTLYLITRPADIGVYSPRWVEHLETRLRLTRPLRETVDVMIWGLMEDGNNNCPTEEDCHPPPTLLECHEALNVSIGVVSLFSRHDRSAMQRVMKDLRHLSSSSSSHLIYGRRYIDAMDGDECASGSKKGGGDCLNNNRTSGARCTGVHGGHVDLVAWDVAEFLHGTPVSVGPSPRSPSGSSSDDDDDEDDYTVCRSPVIQAPGDVFSDTTDVNYHCQGPRYDAFGQVLHAFIHANRTEPHPQAAPPNQRILLFGNSHIKQVAKALACQQMERRQLLSFNHLPTLGGAIMELTHNTTLVMLVNSFVPYSREWKSLLEVELGMTMESFDAVVFGFINHCDGDNAFGREMRRISEQRDDIDCLHVEPPSLVELAAVYSGPIVFVSMLDGSRLAETQRLQARLSSLQRGNIAILDGRKYFHAIGQDCLSPVRLEVSDCAVDNVVEHASHACNGAHGGFADLVAWDVVDFLHENLAS